MSCRDYILRHYGNARLLDPRDGLFLLQTGRSDGYIGPNKYYEGLDKSKRAYYNDMYAYYFRKETTL